MTNKNKLILSLSAAVVLIISACMKDKLDFDKLTGTPYNAEVAIPLVNSSLSIQDIITKGDRLGRIIVDADKFCTLVYKGELFSNAGNDLISLEDQGIPNMPFVLLPADIIAFNSNNTITKSATTTFDFDSDDTEVDSLAFKAGVIHCTINSQILHDGELKITIPSAIKNSSPLVMIVPFKFDGGATVTAHDHFNLEGYTIDMTQAGTTTNKFDVQFEVTFNKVASNSVTPLDVMDVSFEIEDMQFKRLYGYIGQKEITPDDDTVSFAIFGHSLNTGVLKHVEPKVQLHLFNSFGLPTQVKFNTLQGLTYGIPPFNVTGIGVTNPVNVGFPTFPNINEVVTTTHELNNSNSTITSVINANPRFLVYQFSTKTNPAGKIPGQQNFVTDESQFRAEIETFLPFYGTATDFKVQDTFNFQMNQIKNLETMILRLNVENGFPFDVGVQITFVDSAYTPIEELIVPFEIIMPSAQVDANFKVSSPTKKVTDIPLSNERLEKIKNAKKILVTGTANTLNNGQSNIKIYSDYKLLVQLGVRAKVDAEINLRKKKK